MLNIRRALLALALLAVSCGTALAQVNLAAGQQDPAQETKKILLGNNNGYGPWWGAGIDYRQPGCGSDSCTGAVALRFNNNVEPKVGVAIFVTDGNKPYQAYVRGERFPGDTKQPFKGQAWVTIDKNGGFTFINGATWSCPPPKNPNRFEGCVQKRDNGWEAKFTLHLLPVGPSPANWSR